MYREFRSVYRFNDLKLGLKFVKSTELGHSKSHRSYPSMETLCGSMRVKVAYYTIPTEKLMKII